MAQGEPAGGAAVEELVPATIVALLVIGVIAAFGFAHRIGKTRALTSIGRFSERVTGYPAWLGVPAAVTGVSLIVAVFGFYWDVATHIDNGRDPGPFANPAHYLIIFGLAGIALAGALAILLGSEKTRTTVHVGNDWHAPLGGVLLLVCGGIAVMGFPLDDVWHRLFGQDVTLWSPTHMQMVGGAALSTLAFWILIVEAKRVRPNARFAWIEAPIAGALLIGMSAFQAEFDYSVPQFRLLYHPVLIMLSASVALVAARIRLGPGGAIKSAGFFLALRGVLSLLIGPVMDYTALHFPLYIVEAIVIELIARRVSTEDALRFGAWAGVGVGTIGLVAEWGWSHVFMTMEWRGALLPEGVVFGFAAALAGGLLGGILGRSFAGGEVVRRTRVTRRVVAGVCVAIVFLLAYPFPTDQDVAGRATVKLTDVGDGPRRVSAEIHLEPTDMAEDVEWFNVTAWQDGKSRVTPLLHMGNGFYGTSEPIPVHGDWKTLIRLHRGNSIVAVPIYLPEDPAIPAEVVPAKADFTREFISDKEILLREAKDVSTPLTVSAALAMLAIAAVWFTTLGWGLYRLQVPEGVEQPETRPLTSRVLRRRMV